MLTDIKSQLSNEFKIDGSSFREAIIIESVKFLFKDEYCEIYKQSKMDKLKEVGYEKFRSNYLDQKKRLQLDLLLKKFD